MPVNSEREVRLLTRAKWVGVLLPIALIWCFELARWWVIDRSVPSDNAHVFAALLMSGGAVLSRSASSPCWDRVQRRLVDTNQDLAAPTPVASALQGGRDRRPHWGAALDRVLEHSGALAGLIRGVGPASLPRALRRPIDLGTALSGWRRSRGRAGGRGAPWSSASTPGSTRRWSTSR